ncbi:MAG TPA: Rieske (2Fe-2S) protein [Bryobacteraceae bacterium]|nr:Rieske (2Fe-2S) protein [Bryobacteraceae bacterium]
MPFVKVGSVSALAPNSVQEVAIGENYYAICNVEGRIRALGGVCPHRGGPLGQGNVRYGILICPWHAWGFDPETGESDEDPTKHVAAYDVKVEGDDILIQIP